MAEADHYLSKGEVSVALDELEAQFARWALARPDIRAVMVVGSRARQDHPADEWADLDLIIFTTDVRHYLSSSDWMQSLGNVWVASQGKTVRGDPEWLVTLEGGYDADFVFTSSGQLRWALRALALLRRSPQLKRALPPAVEAIIAEFHSGASDVFARGVRVMLDRDRLIRDMRRLFRDRPPANQVTQDSFLSAVNSFWLTAGRAAKKLRRGELWVAKYRCDVLLKDLLRQMIEWHAKATRGLTTDTWHDGHFLEEWADPRAVAGLGTAFAHYDETDVWRALLTTTDLFRWLATETAEALGYAYPKDTDARITGHIARLANQRTKAP